MAQDWYAFLTGLAEDCSIPSLAKWPTLLMFYWLPISVDPWPIGNLTGRVSRAYHSPGTTLTLNIITVCTIILNLNDHYIWRQSGTCYRYYSSLWLTHIKITIITAHYPGPEYNNRLYINNRVFAIYLVILGWKTYKYYCETNELPNPRPTQPNPRKIRLQVATGQKVFFSWVGIGFIYILETDYKNLTQPNVRQHPI